MKGKTQMDHKGAAKLLEGNIPLDKPAIGLAFVSGPPSDVAGLGDAAPSSCAFWYEAESKVFYASAEDHYNCPLGAMVMGFPLPDAQVGLLMQEIGMMCETAYVREEEVPNVPKVEKSASGIVYGPLGELPVEPDVALFWVTPRQAMVVGESAGLMDWADGHAGVYGRPGCTAIPVALSGGRPSQSFGCVGMRINSGISNQFMLMAVPGDKLESLAESLRGVNATHALLKTHYEERAASV